MNDQELEKAAIEAIRKDLEDIQDVRAGPIVNDFLGGSLVVVYVEFKLDADTEARAKAENRQPTKEELKDDYYVHIVDGRTHVYEYPVDLYRIVPTYRPTIWGRIINNTSIPGVMAIVITITICYLAINGQSDKMPQVLSAALTAILGFYFGRVGNK